MRTLAGGVADGRPLEAGSILADNENVSWLSDYGGTEHDDDDIIEQPRGQLVGETVGDVFVWASGGVTPKPVELIRRELAEENEAHSWFLLDRATWPRGAWCASPLEEFED